MIKKPKRTPPVPEVELFTFHSNPRDMLMSNFLDNSKYCLATFGDLGKIIKLMKYPEIERTVIDPTDVETLE